MSTQTKLILAVQIVVVVAAGLTAMFAPWWVWSVLLLVDFCFTPDTQSEDA